MSLKILFKKLKEITMYRNIVFQNWAIAHPQRDHNSIQWVALLAIVYISRKNVNNPYGVFVLKKINRKKKLQKPINKHRLNIPFFQKNRSSQICYFQVPFKLLSPFIRIKSTIEEQLSF
jgi:hypothetical protein